MPIHSTVSGKVRVILEHTISLQILQYPRSVKENVNLTIQVYFFFNSVDIVKFVKARISLILV